MADHHDPGGDVLDLNLYGGKISRLSAQLHVPRTAAQKLMQQHPQSRSSRRKASIRGEVFSAGAGGASTHLTHGADPIVNGVELMHRKEQRPFGGAPNLRNGVSNGLHPAHAQNSTNSSSSSLGISSSMRKQLLRGGSSGNGELFSQGATAAQHVAMIGGAAGSSNCNSTSSPSHNLLHNLLSASPPSAGPHQAPFGWSPVDVTSVDNSPEKQLASNSNSPGKQDGGINADHDMLTSGAPSTTSARGQGANKMNTSPNNILLMPLPRSPKPRSLRRNHNSSNNPPSQSQLMNPPMGGGAVVCSMSGNSASSSSSSSFSCAHDSGLKMKSLSSPSGAVTTSAGTTGTTTTPSAATSSYVRIISGKTSMATAASGPPSVAGDSGQFLQGELQLQVNPGGTAAAQHLSKKVAPNPQLAIGNINTAENSKSVSPIDPPFSAGPMPGSPSRSSHLRRPNSVAALVAGMGAAVSSSSGSGSSTKNHAGAGNISAGLAGPGGSNQQNVANLPKSPPNNSSATAAGSVEPPQNSASRDFLPTQLNPNANLVILKRDNFLHSPGGASLPIGLDHVEGANGGSTTAGAAARMSSDFLPSATGNSATRPGSSATPEQQKMLITKDTVKEMNSSQTKFLQPKMNPQQSPGTTLAMSPLPAGMSPLPISTENDMVVLSAAASPVRPMQMFPSSGGTNSSLASQQLVNPGSPLKVERDNTTVGQKFASFGGDRDASNEVSKKQMRLSPLVMHSDDFIRGNSQNNVGYGQQFLFNTEDREPDAVLVGTGNSASSSSRRDYNRIGGGQQNVKNMITRQQVVPLLGPTPRGHQQQQQMNQHASHASNLTSENAALKLRHETAITKSSHSSSTSISLQKSNSLLNTAVEKLLAERNSGATSQQQQQAQYNSRSSVVAERLRTIPHRKTYGATTLGPGNVDAGSGNVNDASDTASTAAASAVQELPHRLSRPTSAARHYPMRVGTAAEAADPSHSRFLKSRQEHNLNRESTTAQGTRGGRTASGQIDYVKAFKVSDDAAESLVRPRFFSSSNVATPVNDSTSDQHKLDFNIKPTDPAVRKVRAKYAAEQERKRRKRFCDYLSQMKWGASNSSKTGENAAAAASNGLFKTEVFTDTEEQFEEQDFTKNNTTPRGLLARQLMKEAQLRKQMGIVTDGGDENLEQQEQILNPGGGASNSRPDSRTSSVSNTTTTTNAGAVVPAAGEQVVSNYHQVRKSNGGPTTTAAGIATLNKKTKKGRIMANRHPQSDTVSLLESAFPQFLGPTVYFEYPNQMQYPRVMVKSSAVLTSSSLTEQEHQHQQQNSNRFNTADRLAEKAKNARIFKNLNGTKIPTMYWLHTNKVHVYNCVLNSMKKGGLQYYDSKIESTHPRYSLIWNGHFKPEKLRQMHSLQRTNHFPYSWYLGRKDLMCRNIMRMKRQYINEFDITPETFILPEDGKKFLEVLKGGNPNKNSSSSSNAKIKSDLWISKPVNSSCGKGIKLIGSHSNGLEKMAKQYRVVQKYVNPPLLIKGYKFDLRIYVVITSFDPLKIYLFREGLVRFATEKYSAERKSDLRSRKVHLTNYSVNKNATNYKKNMDGAAPRTSSTSTATSPQKQTRASTPSGTIITAGTTRGQEPQDQDEDITLGSENEDENDPTEPPEEPGDQEDVDIEDQDSENESFCGEEEDLENEGPESKWSLSQLEEYFNQQGWDYEKCFSEVKALVVKAAIAVEPIIVSTLHRSTNLDDVVANSGGGNGNSSGNKDGSSGSTVGDQSNTSPCFEIYGFDVLLDANRRPWLLEVNVSPSLSSSSPLDRRIKTMLLADTLTLIGLRPFDSEQIQKERKHAAKNRTSRKLAIATSSDNSSGNTASHSKHDGGKPKKLGQGLTNLLLGQLHEKGPNFTPFLQQFQEPEWRLILEHVDETYRSSDLEPLFPRSKEVALQFSEFFPTPRISNRILAVFYLCGGEKILKSRKLQEQLKLDFLLQNNIILNAAKI
ncbi:unnamed protein product [Amoebophrya sp. A120]|nr:unnamed protein product [Amoebophrya sp. A120]|eukprot:GSA120T00019239001.1